MKKLLLFLLFISLKMFGQSVTILPQSANPSISGNTLLIPTEAQGYNHTNGIVGVGTYVGSGTAYIQTHTPHPLSFAVANGAAAMTISYSSTSNLNKNIGINIQSPQEKLHVVGNIRASSLAGTGVRNVSADANGTLTTAPQIAFAVQDIGATNLLVPTNSYVILPFGDEDYDLSNNYNATTGIFTAPQNGIYHFDAYALWALPTTSVGKFMMQILVDEVFYIQTGTPIVANVALSSELSTDLKLITGQEVKIVVFQNSGVNQSIFSANHFTRFTGRLVMSL